MSGAYHRLERCRVTGSRNLIPVLHLGEQELTGVFPSPGEDVTVGPLELVWCPDSGLLQLAHSFDPAEMYGDNYGYRSGLNASMVHHLTQKIGFLETLADLKPGDTVLDIGSNDATSLKAYQTPGLKRIGIDPDRGEVQGLLSGRHRAGSGLLLCCELSQGERQAGPHRDLDRDVLRPRRADRFARDIASVLAPDGVWHFEQSYMPAMLRTTSYDTICHEHLEYYSLGVVQKILEAADLKLVDVQMNGINGGSFAVTAAPKASSRPANDAVVDWLLGQEDRMGLNTVRPFREFEDRVFRHKADLLRLLKALAADGKKVLGYGASTKGNVTLQFSAA
jgi:hypothetical protein